LMHHLEPACFPYQKSLDTMKRKARVVRCYTDQSLHANSEIELDKRSSHHLSTVLRARAGLQIQLFNGDGQNYTGEVINTGKRTIVALATAVESNLASSLKLTLVQAIARGDKMDGIVRQATELGVNAIQPIYTQLSISTLDEKRAARKREHWQSITISACEQSGRAVLPEVQPIRTLSQYLRACQPVMSSEQRWILSPVATPVQSAVPSLTNATVMIGPESGFDTDEIVAAEAVGFTALQLGPRILRTETAGPAAIAVLQTRFGDFFQA